MLRIIVNKRWWAQILGSQHFRLSDHSLEDFNRMKIRIIELNCLWSDFQRDNRERLFSGDLTGIRWRVLHMFTTFAAFVSTRVTIAYSCVRLWHLCPHQQVSQQSIIKKSFNKTNNISRSSLLQYKEKQKCKRTPCVLTYHPCLRNSFNTIRGHWTSVK
jgi:hypothetical protein